MRKICKNFNCSVYVFGGPTDICPECKQPGKELTTKQNDEFMVFYRKVDWS